jgi:hypothetical protein
MVKYPVLDLIFDEPQSGYWDGGKKEGGTFSPSPREFKRAGTIQWGSWAMNFWFNAGAGKSWNEAISIAKRKLHRNTRPPHRIEIRWEESD